MRAEPRRAVAERPSGARHPSGAPTATTSDQREAAVDGEGLAGDVGRVGREEEDDDGRDLGRGALPAERHRGAVARRAAARRPAAEWACR